MPIDYAHYITNQIISLSSDLPVLYDLPGFKNKDARYGDLSGIWTCLARPTPEKYLDKEEKPNQRGAKDALIAISCNVRRLSE